MKMKWGADEGRNTAQTSSPAVNGKKKRICGGDWTFSSLVFYSDAGQSALILCKMEIATEQMLVTSCQHYPKNPEKNGKTKWEN